MNRKKRSLFYVIFFVLILLFFEFSFRIFYSIQFEKSEILTSPASILEEYYPGIREAMSEQIRVDNNTIDILLLGASVLNPYFGKIEQKLEEKLSTEFSCRVNIDNFAFHSHSSLDSRIKYELLKDQHYDVILLYHGINEVRFNNCPEAVFKADYSHVKFYNEVYGLTTKLSKFSILPYTFCSLKMKILSLLDTEKLLPLGVPENKEWLEYGKDIKTANSFYENYKAIVELANKNNTAVVTPTFAHYVPADYNYTDFVAKKLPYTSFTTPIELWGIKENVVKGIVAHNQSIKHYANENTQLKNLYFVDLNNSITKKKEHFDDICHLTPDGSAEYVSIIFPTFKSIIDKRNLCLTNVH